VPNSFSLFKNLSFRLLSKFRLTQHQASFENAFTESKILGTQLYNHGIIFFFSYVANYCRFLAKYQRVKLAFQKKCMLWKAFFPPFSAVCLPALLLKAGLVFSYFDPSN